MVILDVHNLATVFFFSCAAKVYNIQLLAEAHIDGLLMLGYTTRG